MGKFIIKKNGTNRTSWFFGEADAYGAGEDVRLDYYSEIFCLQIHSLEGKKVSFGTIQDFYDCRGIDNEILDFLFNGKKVDENLYQRLCAIAGATLIAQSQKLLASAGMASNTNVTIPSDHNKAASDAARQILKPGTLGASLTILSKQSEITEVYNPAIGNFDGLETSIYQGELVN